MKAVEAKEIFHAMAVANGHPSPADYAELALAAWKNPPAPAEPEPPVEQPPEGE